MCGCQCILPTVVAQGLKCINKELCLLNSNIVSGFNQIEAMLAHDFPLTVAAEYPTECEDKVVYSTAKVRLLDMLNPNLYILFKGVIPVNKPVYFKDTSNYEHIVSLTDGGLPVMADTLVNNKVYTALYIGNYIVIN